MDMSSFFSTANTGPEIPLSKAIQANPDVIPTTSQIRGPSCAREFTKKLQLLYPDSKLSVYKPQPFPASDQASKVLLIEKYYATDFRVGCVNMEVVMRY